MTEVAYELWKNDSHHDVYDTANKRRVELFEEKIEGLQVKVKRTSEGKFIVKTRVPVPPKPVAKKKAPAKKSTRATTKKAPAKRATSAAKKKAATKAEAPSESPKTEPAKKRTTRKTSRKRK